MFVYQVMSTHVVAVRPEDSADQAARDLIEREITGLPVIDEAGHVLGVLTELDLLRAVRNGHELERMTVAEVMDRPPLFVGPETDLNTAIELMNEWQIRRLPVCVGTRLVGIVSRGDILAGLAGHSRPRGVTASAVKGEREWTATTIVAASGGIRHERLSHISGGVTGGLRAVRYTRATRLAPGATGARGSGSPLCSMRQAL